MGASPVGLVYNPPAWKAACTEPAAVLRALRAGPIAILFVVVVSCSGESFGPSVRPPRSGGSIC